MSPAKFVASTRTACDPGARPLYESGDEHDLYATPSSEHVNRGATRPAVNEIVTTTLAIDTPTIVTTGYGRTAIPSGRAGTRSSRSTRPVSMSTTVTPSQAPASSR